SSIVSRSGRATAPAETSAPGVSRGTTTGIRTTVAGSRTTSRVVLDPRSPSASSVSLTWNGTPAAAATSSSPVSAGGSGGTSRTPRRPSSGPATKGGQDAQHPADVAEAAEQFPQRVGQARREHGRDGEDHDR